MHASCLRALGLMLAVFSLPVSGRVLPEKRRHLGSTAPEAEPRSQAVPGLELIESWHTATADNNPGAELLISTVISNSQDTAVPPAAEQPMLTSSTVTEPPDCDKEAAATLAAETLQPLTIASSQPEASPSLLSAAGSDAVGTSSTSSAGSNNGSSSESQTAAVIDSSDVIGTAKRRTASNCSRNSTAAAVEADPSVSSASGLPQSTNSSNSSGPDSSSGSALPRGGAPLTADALPLPAGAVARVAAIGVPDRCIVAGSGLFSSCSVEITAAQSHFNITVPYLAPQNYSQLLHERGFTRAQVLAYLQEALAKPSNACCAAQCCFNQLLLCDCEPSVLQVAVRFTGADEPFYALMISQLARACGIKHHYGSSCPANLSVPATGAACVAGNVWPPVQSTAPAAASVAGSLVAAASGVGNPPNGLVQTGEAHRVAGDALVCLALTEKDEALAVLSANLVVLNTSNTAGGGS